MPFLFIIMRTPVQIGCILFRKVKSFEFLLLKRVESRGGYWQCVTGGVEDDESAVDAVYREVFEETGIRREDVISFIEGVFECEFETDSFNKLFGDKTIIKSYDFGAQVSNSQKIRIDPAEHDEYKWVDYETALELLKWENNKNALKELVKKIIPSLMLV